MTPAESYAIVPAAGHSLRMGRHKLLMPWGGTTVIRHVLATWKVSRVSHVVVVVRPDDEALAAECRQSDVDVVIPITAPEEMKASVQHGLRHVQQTYRPKATDVWLLAPADIPGLSGPTIDRLLSAHQGHSPAILAPTWDGRRGHPVLFPWPLGSDVFRLGDGEGVNVLMSRHQVHEIDCSAQDVPDDLDSPDDYRRLHDRANPS